MGLANLVPGISGGTMLLAAGVYPGFIAAIADVTTLRFPPQASRWQAWLAEERRWYAEDYGRLVRAFERGREAEVRHVLFELGRHRIERHRIALAVADLLDAEDSATLRCVCATLRKLGSKVVVDGLLEIVEDDDPAVVREALKTLKALTGQDLPPEKDAWREALVSTPQA